MVDVDGFLSYKGDGCFRIKKKLSKNLKLMQGEDFIVKFDEHGNFVAIRARRYYDGHRDFTPLWQILRKLDEYITGRIRNDDEILQKILFNGDR